MARSLSKAQLRILQFQADHQEDRIYCFGYTIHRWSSFHWVRAYEAGPRLDRRSVNHLIKSGYIELLPINPSSSSRYYNITEAGRQALAEHDA